MDLRKALLKEHTKAQRDVIAQCIGQDAVQFAQLVGCMLSKEPVLAQRASWVVSSCVEHYPELAHPHLAALIQNLHHPTQHNAIKRNTLRLLQFVEIDEVHWGDLADLCFAILSSNKEPVAIQVFAMSVLLKIVQKEPALKTELQFILEDKLPYAQGGYLSRAKKVLAALKRV